MTDTNPMHDHYTVISRAGDGDVHTSRVDGQLWRCSNRTLRNVAVLVGCGATVDCS